MIENFDLQSQTCTVDPNTKRFTNTNAINDHAAYETEIELNFALTLNEK